MNTEPTLSNTSSLPMALLFDSIKGSSTKDVCVLLEQIDRIEQVIEQNNRKIDVANQRIKYLNSVIKTTGIEDP